MGVDHGGGDRRGQVPPPQNLERGDANTNCSPQILSYTCRYKNERSVAFNIRQNPFSAGAPPRTPLGELMTLPRPLSRLERGHPSPYATPLGTDPPSALAMRPPQKSSQIYAYVSDAEVVWTIVKFDISCCTTLNGFMIWDVVFEVCLWSVRIPLEALQMVS